MFIVHCLVFSGPALLFRWRLSEAAPMCDLRKRFPVLFALADRFSRVSERDDRKHVKLFRYSEERLHVIESHKPHPIRSDSFGPRRQNHRLNRT